MLARVEKNMYEQGGWGPHKLASKAGKKPIFQKVVENLDEAAQMFDLIPSHRLIHIIVPWIGVRAVLKVR